MAVILCTVICTILLGVCANVDGQNKVKLVTVVHRHGDRTPDASTLYPRDPYINETYLPFGLGQLTSRGKMRMYDVGQMLRKKYSNYLGHLYIPGQIEAISTNFNRTKASLALLLAGLYPPKNSELDWNRELNWDPIPYNYLTYDNDLWMTTSLFFCSNYAKYYEKYMSSPAGLALMRKNWELYQFLSENSGLDITSPPGAWLVYSCLLSQNEWGLKLPIWTKSVFPDALESATVDALNTFVATTQLKQLSGGFMLQRLINNMKAKLQNNISSRNVKMHIWSAHDLNILYLSGALNQPITHSVPYGAYYIIELVEIRGVDYVTIYTIDYLTRKQVQVKIPGCELYCPFNQFVKLLEKNLPVGDNPCGSDLSHVQKYNNRRDYYLGRVSSESIVKHYARVGVEKNAADRSHRASEVV